MSVMNLDGGRDSGSGARNGLFFSAPASYRQNEYLASRAQAPGRYQGRVRMVNKVEVSG